MKTAAIIQAREGSTRLPGKVLLKVRGKTILEWMVERVSRSSFLDNIIIATTLSSPNIIDLCKERRWNYFVGSEDDVLSRVKNTINCFDVDLELDAVVDLTSDCPFVDWRQIDCLLAKLDSYPEIEYASNINPRQWPDGFDIQIYRPETLFLMDFMLPHESKYRQHSGWNILRKWPHKCQYNYRPIPRHNIPNMRLTLDYQEDLEVIKNIINYFDEDIISVSAENIIDYVLENPKILVNRHLESKQPGE